MKPHPFGRKLKPETAEETKEVETIEGMRLRVREYARDDNLVYHVLRMAEARGLSGEDTMTMLAYHALLERERFRDMIVDERMGSTEYVVTLNPPLSKEHGK